MANENLRARETVFTGGCATILSSNLDGNNAIKLSNNRPDKLRNICYNSGRQIVRHEWIYYKFGFSKLSTYPINEKCRKTICAETRIWASPNNFRAQSR